MKPKHILCLALILSGGLFGCSTNPPAAKTQILDYSIGDSPAAGIVITGLGKSFSIRESADSWPALIQKTKPIFAWNGCAMMWIETDQRGQPKFILDEAYVYQPTNQPRQWILVRDERTEKNQAVWKDENWWRQFGNYNLHAEINLQDVKPPSEDDGYYGNYAVVKSANRHFGVVYEIGWQDEMSDGNGHPIYSRRIYLFKDSKNHWHFLGEGPAEGAQRGGEDIVESSIEWSNSKPNEIPLQIHIQCELTESPIGYEADDTNRPPDVTTTNEFVLADKFPAQLQKLK